jgi:hypothetical protein
MTGFFYVCNLPRLLPCLYRLVALGAVSRRGDAFRLHGQVLISLDLAQLAPIMRTSSGADLSENLF